MAALMVLTRGRVVRHDFTKALAMSRPRPAGEIDLGIDGVMQKGVV